MVDRLDTDNDEGTYTAQEIRRVRRAAVTDPLVRVPDLTAKQVQREQRRLAALARVTRRG